MSEDRNATLLWLRRDLRLADHAALTAAIARGGPVVPVVIVDSETEALGAAPKWRLAESLKALSRDLQEIGGRLIVRRGAALDILRVLAAESGAGAVFWSRLYDPASIARDTGVKAGLAESGLLAKSFEGFLLREPFKVETKTGGFYKVYTPYWRATSVLQEPDAPLAAPARWPAPERWPNGVALGDLVAALQAPMNRGGAVVARHVAVGAAAAEARLDAFLAEDVGRYHRDRDRLDRAGTSRLSAHLSLGEISPRRAWTATRHAVAERPELEAGAEVFLKEIVWREFAWHLAYHTPHIFERNWRSEWDAFPWRGAEDNPNARAWTQGRTGVPAIDAAMRELYVTGVMHNRARMLVASYLTKNLLTDWRVGEAWFRAHLVDFDPASNAMGWQWAAGSGPDAAPFFRIFNPSTQLEKFDPEGAYVARWLPERTRGARAHADGLSFFEACPRAWRLSPDDPYPTPPLSLAEGRARALQAYESLRAAS